MDLNKVRDMTSKMKGLHSHCPFHARVRHVFEKHQRFSFIGRLKRILLVDSMKNGWGLNNETKNY